MAISYKTPLGIKIFLICYLITIIVKYLFFRKEKKYFKNEWKTFLFGLYVAYILCINIFPIVIPLIGTKSYNINLNILQIFEYDKNFLFLYIYKTISLFIPLPILGEICGIKLFKSLRWNITISFLFATLCEIIQYIEAIVGLKMDYANIDINDILLNICGSLIGWSIFNLWKKVNLNNKRQDIEATEKNTSQFSKLFE